MVRKLANRNKPDKTKPVKRKQEAGYGQNTNQERQITKAWTCHSHDVGARLHKTILRVWVI